MTRFRNCFALALTVLVFSSVSAQALELSPVLGLNLSSVTDPNGTLKPSLKVGFGLGGFLSFGVVPMVLDAELGALYMTRRLEYNQAVTATSTVLADSTAHTLQFPLVARLKVIPLINPGLGFYYASTLGDVTVKTPTGETSGAPTSRSDYGLVGSVQFKLPLLPLFGLLADARYNFGLHEVGGSKTRELQFLAGASLGF